MLGGVAAGVADYLDADPALVRIGWVAIALITGGLGALAYLAAWVLVPQEGVVTSEWRSRPKSHSRWGGLAWGAILVLVGVIALISQLDVPMPPLRAILAGALVLVGFGIIVSARKGLNGGLTVLAILLTVLLSTSTAIPLGDVDSAFDDRVVTVHTPGQLESHYGHAFGALRLNIDPAGLADGTTTLDTNIAFGDLRVAVPAGVGLRVTAHTVFGSTHVEGAEVGNGIASERVVTSPDYDRATKRVDINVKTVFGSTRVTRGQP